MSQDDLSWEEVDEELHSLREDLASGHVANQSGSVLQAIDPGTEHLFHTLIRYTRAFGRKIQSLEKRIEELEHKNVTAAPGRSA